MLSHLGPCVMVFVYLIFIWFSLFQMKVKHHCCYNHGFVLNPSKVIKRGGVVPVKNLRFNGMDNMGVSKNWGTPKWMLYKGKHPIRIDDLGGNPYFWKHPSFFFRFEHPRCWKTWDVLQPSASQDADNYYSQSLWYSWCIFWVVLGDGEKNITSWWFQPLWKILVKMDHLPK